jgi:hypothetical protein
MTSLTLRALSLTHHRNSKVATEMGCHICSEPRSDVTDICHDQNAISRGEFEGVFEVPMQRLRLQQQLNERQSVPIRSSKCNAPSVLQHHIIRDHDKNITQIWL